jgi:type VI secretion system protein ImpL
MLGKIARILLVVLALLLLAALCWVLAVWFDLPRWGSAIIFLGVVALALGVKFFRRIVDRFSPGRRAAQAIQDGDRTKPAESAENIAHLRTQWKRGLATLRASNLREKGDPVYALPWYLALGRTGSGTTVALARAGLISAIQENTPPKSGPETRSCEWFFFDRSVVIDASGRYVARDQDEDTREGWRAMLALISRHRRREPLNGLILAVPADWLLFAARDAVAEEGRLIRGRIDQLMRVLDTRFPVYVLVTKCDVLYGMDDWTRHLPEATLTQAMGYAGAGEVSDPTKFIKEAFDSVSDRLRDLRLLLTREVDAATPATLLFPNEFERLRPPLDAFFKSAFGTDPYLETPFLRGLFFGSAAQLGGVSSYVLKDTGLPEQSTMLSGTMRSLFLHDPLGRIIPDDRHLHRPLGRALRWQRVTRNLGLSAWLLFGVVAAGLLTFSFTHTFDTVGQLRERYPSPVPLTGKFAPDLQRMTQYHGALDWMQKRDRSWLFGVAPFSRNVQELEHRLRENFSLRFREFVESELDSRIARRIKPMAEREPDEVTARYTQFIVRRINLLKARAAGDDKALAELPPPTRSGLTLAQVHGDLSADDISPEAAGLFGELYRQSLRWRPNDGSVQRELQILSSWLNQIALNRPDLKWLAVWANEQTYVKPVTLRQFWDGSLRLPEPVEVEGAYTADGEKAIRSFLGEVEATGTGSGFAAKKEEFEQWYREQRRKAWVNFVMDFDAGLDTLDGPREWKLVMQRLGSPTDPYLSLLDRLESELGDGNGKEAGPEWLGLVHSLALARQLAARDDLLGKLPAIGGTGRLAIKGAREGGAAKGVAVVDLQLKAGHAFGEYRSQITKAWNEALASNGQAVKLATETFEFASDPQGKPTAVTLADRSLAELETLLGGTDYGSRAIWGLMHGPLRVLLGYGARETGCAVQREWETRVLAPAKAAPAGNDISEALYGEKGSVWAFADGVAKPFLARDSRHYDARSVMDVSVPFEPSLMLVFDRAMAWRHGRESAKESQLLAQERAKLEDEQRRWAEERQRDDLARASQQAQDRLKGVDAALASLKTAIEGVRNTPIPVTISGLPTNVSPGATSLPHATVLRVQCSAGQRTLTNYNAPGSESFSWSSSSCGDTSLDIQFDRFTLTRKWAGPLGFADFLREFRDGLVSFRPADFPGQRQAIEQLGITKIDVRYEFVGQEAILRKQAELAQLESEQRQKQDERRSLVRQIERAENLVFEEKQQGLRDRSEGLRQRDQLLAQREARLAAGKDAKELPLPAKAAGCWDRPVPVARFRPAPEPAAAPVPPPAAEQGLKPAEKAAPKPEPKPTPKPAPKPAPKHAAKAASKPVAKAAAAAPAMAAFVVQVGAFGPENVDQVLGALRKAGYATSTEPVRNGDGPVLQRVRAGSYPTAEAAMQAAGEIDRMLQLQSKVIRTTAPPPASR